MIIRAKLIKRKTNDGLMEIEEDIPLGKEYYVDFHTKTIMTFQNLETGQIHEKEMIRTYPHKPNDWLPIELLEILGAP